MTITLLVGRQPSVNAIEKAMSRDRLLFVTAQKRSEVADPQHDELHRVGAVVRVLQLFRLPDGSLRVLVEGLLRAEVKRFQWSADFYTVQVAPAPDGDRPAPEHEALVRHGLSLFQEYVHLNRRIPDEVVPTTTALTDPAQVSFTMAGHLLVKTAVKQRLLEAADAATRLRLLAETITAELEILRLERRSRARSARRCTRTRRSSISTSSSRRSARSSGIRTSSRASSRNSRPRSRRPRCRPRCAPRRPRSSSGCRA
jgi:ATP-dependent Lon protease